MTTAMLFWDSDPAEYHRSLGTMLVPCYTRGTYQLGSVLLPETIYLYRKASKQVQIDMYYEPRYRASHNTSILLIGCMFALSAISHFGLYVPASLAHFGSDNIPDQ